jgi:membrane-associated phospholipid phosphatase
MALYNLRTALAQRFDPTRFYGRPLTAIILAFAASLFLFGGLLQDIVEQESIVLFDARFSSLIASLRDPILTQFFYAMTFIGQGPTAVVMVSILLIVLFLYKKRIYIPGLLISVIGSETMDSLIKLYVHRPRPTGPIPLFTETSFSFPSGHATIAVALYGFLIYIFYRVSSKRRERIGAAIIGGFVILGIGASRIYLGVHFFSDVMGGYLLGFLWLLIGIGLIEWLERNRNKKIEQH